MAEKTFFTAARFAKVRFHAKTKTIRLQKIVCENTVCENTSLRECASAKVRFCESALLRERVFARAHVCENALLLWKCACPNFYFCGKFRDTPLHKYILRKFVSAKRNELQLPQKRIPAKTNSGKRKTNSQKRKTNSAETNSNSAKPKTELLQKRTLRN